MVKLNKSRCNREDTLFGLANNAIEPPGNLTPSQGSSRAANFHNLSVDTNDFCTQPMAAEFSTDHLLCIADFLDNKDLSSLCRCCKWSNDLIQPRIFHRISLGNPEDEDSPKKWTSFEAFRQVLERSPHLAYYPREVEIRLAGWNTDDLTFVLAELTGKNVSSVKLTAGGWVDASVKQAAEAFLRDTILPLNVKISGLQSISASCLRLTHNLILFNCAVHSTGPPDDWNIKTLSTSGSLSIGTSFFLNTHPCLTHLMLSWEAPSGEPGEWYAYLGAGLASMPKLVLLTVQYSGTNFDFDFEHIIQRRCFSRWLHPGWLHRGIRLENAECHGQSS